jgi:organic radical activating enzyme
MKAGQKNIAKVLNELDELDDPITNVTFETNGTRAMGEELRQEILARQHTTEFFFSVSPKIWSTSGEKDRICPDVVQEYYGLSLNGQLKFVCNGTDQSWDEIEDAIASFRHSGVMYPIWIMPVGATEESQDEIAAEIAEQTMDRGYNVSARVHCYIWGNQIGT